jgi:hypothetical protein
MSKEKTSKPQQSRKFCLTTYYDVDNVKAILEELQLDGVVQHWALQLHDKDLKDDGTPKENHVHIILITYKKTTCNKVRAMFYGCTPDGQQAVNTLAQICENLDGAFDYLTHNTPQARADGKYQYSMSDTETDFDPFWCEKGLESREVDTLTQAVFDFASGCLSHTDLLKRYGRDFIINYRSVREVAFMISEEYRQTAAIYQKNCVIQKTEINKMTGEVNEY